MFLVTPGTPGKVTISHLLSFDHLILTAEFGIAIVGVTLTLKYFLLIQETLHEERAL